MLVKYVTYCLFAGGICGTIDLGAALVSVAIFSVSPGLSHFLCFFFCVSLPGGLPLRTVGTCVWSK